MRFRALSIALLASITVTAQANLIVNGSFEDGAFNPNGDNTMSLPNGSTAMTGWTVDPGTVAWISDPNPFNGYHASDGIKSLDLTDYSGNFGGVHQSFATVVGGAYMVEFDLGAHSSYGDASLSVNVGQGDTGYTLHSDSGMLWEHQTYNFVATSTTTDLLFVHNFDGGNATGLDNVVVTMTSVPEPASMALLALAPLALRRRRK